MVIAAGVHHPTLMGVGNEAGAMGIVPLGEQDVPQFSRVLADSDLDGLFGAAVLKAFRPDAEVVFTHAAALRSGLVDHLIDRSTALVDLPFHPACGWYVDHHLTNRPDVAASALFEADGGTQHWEPTPSAARLAYELLAEITEMDHLESMMPLVDALDSGGISKEAFLADGPLLQLARTCTSKDPDYMQHLLVLLADGASQEVLLSDPVVDERCKTAGQERAAAQAHIEANTTVHDRLAVCRMDETPYRSNGYLVTAWVGDAADACCIVHGYADGDLSTPERPPLSASFYANSFLANGQGKYDLSRMATSLDVTGGGHANACGCRIQPPGLASNLDHWLEMWSKREELLLC